MVTRVPSPGLFVFHHPLEHQGCPRSRSPHYHSHVPTRKHKGMVAKKHVSAVTFSEGGACLYIPRDMSAYSPPAIAIFKEGW